MARFGISERMRTSIRGMGQALKNIEDGVNLLNTAEGGLAQVTDMLQRMRELALQSCNGVLTDEQRQYLQTEHSQLLEQADMLAVNTEFNGHKVLSPVWEKATTRVSTSAVDIVLVVDRTGSMGGPIGNVKDNLIRFVDTMKAGGLNVRLGLVTYGDTNHGEAITHLPLTGDVDAIRSQIGAIIPGGGADIFESALEGIMDPTTGAITANFRPEPTGGTYLNIQGSFREQLEQVAGQIIKEAGVTRTEEPVVQLQVGVRASDTVSVKLFDARVENLGLKETAVDPREKALEALGKVDAVLSARSEYGSHAEALEHAKAQVTQSAIALTEAESRIADADMAFEMARLTKDQLLIQTATTLIAQAKVPAEMVLKLVRGGA